MFKLTWFEFSVIYFQRRNYILPLRFAVLSFAVRREKCLVTTQLLINVSYAMSESWHEQMNDRSRRVRYTEEEIARPSKNHADFAKIIVPLFEIF